MQLKEGEKISIIGARQLAEEEHFFALIHAGFAHKRKFVRKNLIEAGLPVGNIPEKARAEDLALSDWLTLCKV